MSFKAVLFDLDGTLLDTIDDLADAMNAALAAMGFPALPVSKCKFFVGDGVEQFASRALPEGHRDEQTVRKLLPIYRDAYAACWANKTRPYEDIPQLLDGLTQRGLAMAVFSNKPDEFTRLMVSRLLGKWKFQAVIGARQDWPKKPDPTVALEIARQLAVPPEQFIYLGDTNTDMQTACAARMYAVGALWGFRTAEELLANGAKVLVEKPTDLLTIL